MAASKLSAFIILTTMMLVLILNSGLRVHGYSDQWNCTIVITVSGSNLSDEVVFGEAYNASNGIDSHDMPNPPPSPPPILDAYFIENLSEPYNRLQRDVKFGPVENNSWTLIIYYSNTESRNITLSWSNSSLLKSEYNIFSLVDCLTGFKWDMIKESAITIQMSPGEIRKFKIEASKDYEPPKTVIIVGSPSIPMNNVTYITSSTTISLNASDNKGVKSTYYRLSIWTSWKIYQSPFNISNVPDGPYTLKYYSVDIYGNVEETRSINILLDNTPPNTTSMITENLMLSLVAVDNGVGVSSTYYCIDCSEWNVYSTPIDLNILPPGEHEVKYYSIDFLGNKELVKKITLTVPSPTTPTTPIASATPTTHMTTPTTSATQVIGTETTQPEQPINMATVIMIALGIIGILAMLLVILKKR